MCCWPLPYSTLILGVLPLHQIAHVGHQRAHGPIWPWNYFRRIPTYVIMIPKHQGRTDRRTDRWLKPDTHYPFERAVQKRPVRTSAKEAPVRTGRSNGQRVVCIGLCCRITALCASIAVTTKSGNMFGYTGAVPILITLRTHYSEMRTSNSL